MCSLSWSTCAWRARGVSGANGATPRVAAAPLRCAAHVATGGGHVVARSSASIVLSVVLTWRACSARGSSGRRSERFVHARAAGT